MTRTCLALLLALSLAACKKEAPKVEPVPTPGSAAVKDPKAPSTPEKGPAEKAPDKDAITKEEAEKFGKEFAAALSPCDAAKADALIDAQKFTSRFDASTRSQIGTFDKLGESLCAGLGPESAVRFVGVVQKDGINRPRIRTIVRGGVNFLDVLVVREPDKSLKLMDVYSLRNGEEMSGLLSLVGKLISHGEAAARAYIDATQQHGAGNYAEAKASFMKIPAEVRTKVKAIALQGLTIDVQQPAEVYLASIEEFRKNFPNDPSVNLVEIDAHSLKNDFPKLVATLDSLLARTNNDPYVLIMRARAHQRAEAFDKATADAMAAVTAEPEMMRSDGGDLLVDLAVAQKKYADAVGYLDKMLNETFTKDAIGKALAEDKMYAGFRASKEFKAWRDAK
ncbi:MAG: hypothetical protein ACKV2T_39360 [Kofleriaceae bacterium]